MATGNGAPAAGTGKNIVLCSDGTGNQGGKQRGTNVWAVFNAVWRQPDSKGRLPDRAHTAFYDDGVGTQSFKLFKLLGGAFGWGYSRNMRELYKSLVLVYEPGDQIYLFGFSRGAYTVRGLAGMILQSGILDRHAFTTSAALDAAVWDVFRDYRQRYKALADRLFPWLLKGNAKRYSGHKQAGRIHDLDQAGESTTRIRFLGVWDTVDAVGLPFDWLADRLDNVVRFRFADQNLSPRVGKACHAVAIDDARRTFWPVMWNEQGETSGRIEQVWFAGVHSNVGGGYPKDQMARVALDWMMQQAEANGLQFYRDPRAEARTAANVHGQLYDSRAGLAAYYRYAPRDFGEILRDRKAGIEIATPRIHFSALRRTARATADYAPANLPDAIEVVGTHDEDLAKAAEIQQAFAATAGERAGGLKRAGRYIALRRWLYRAFLLYSLSILAIAAWFRWSPLAPDVPPVTDLHWSIDWLFKLCAAILPDWLQNFFAPLIAYLKVHWILALAAAGVLALLALLKMWWEARSRHLALDAWREFREAIHNGDRARLAAAE